MAAPLTCIIVDDEINCTEVLAYEIGRMSTTVSIVGQFNDPHEALRFLQSDSVDIIFLDVEMPGLSGFDLLERLPDLSASVVFTTAYNEYAVRAFKYMAIDYLMKPVDREELEQAVQRVGRSKRDFSHSLIMEIKHSLQSPNSVLNRIALPNDQGYVLVDISAIAYCQADSNYAIVYLSDGITHMVSKPLKYLDELLTGQGFCRVHQSWLINTNHIRSYTRSDGGVVSMSDGRDIRVAKSKKAVFEQLLTGLRW